MDTNSICGAINKPKPLMGIFSTNEIPLLLNISQKINSILIHHLLFIDDSSHENQECATRGRLYRRIDLFSYQSGIVYTV